MMNTSPQDFLDRYKTLVTMAMPPIRDGSDEDMGAAGVPYVAIDRRYIPLGTPNYN
jgi:hypothetical protein